MAQAGALLGLVVPDIVLDDIGCTSKTMPEFEQLWTTMIDDAAAVSEAGQAVSYRARTSTNTRPSTAPAGAPGRGPRTAPTTPRPRPG